MYVYKNDSLFRMRIMSDSSIINQIAYVNMVNKHTKNIILHILNKKIYVPKIIRSFISGNEHKA